MSKANIEDRRARRRAVKSATKNAIRVPFKVMKTSYQILELLEKMINDEI
ncbi:MAG: cyclodeaminase/cyclohydrolase family protein [Saprospiraceae bacterium]